MNPDDAILREIRIAFETIERPEHFTDYTHCEECAEHDAMLQSRNLDTLSYEDVQYIGFDPICFCTPNAFAYYLPALARIACTEQPDHSWFGAQFFWHLSYSERVEACSPQQRAIVVKLLHHMLKEKAELIERECATEDIAKAIETWSKNHPIAA